MARFTRGLVVTLGVVLLGLFITLVPQKNASGQNSQPVVVKNTPLPTTVTNTPLPITGNVNVTNAPLPVSVTNSLSVTGSLSGLITNPANNPVLVSNVNDSVDRVFSFNLCEADYSTPADCGTTPTILAGGAEEFVSSFTIPTTTPKGLPVTQAVIEYVAGICRADLNDDIVEVGLQNVPSVGISFFSPGVRTPGVPRVVFPVPEQTMPTTWSFDHTTKLYLPPGLSVNLFVRSTGMPNSSTFAQKCDVNFNGTLLTQ